MAAHLITGYKGSEHIQSADARSFNMAMFGGGEFVMEIGEQLDASITNNNTVRILDGDILMQGGHIRIETGTYEDMTIETGTAGKSRIDLIVMTYEKNALDGTEKAYLEVIKGTPTEGTPTDPAYEQGTLAEGDLKNQMPLYRVKVEGVVLTSLEVLFKTIPTYKTIAEQYAAQFQKACDTYLGALNVLDTMEEVNANTQTNQLAGALAVKEGIASLNLKLEAVHKALLWSNSDTSKSFAAQTITLDLKSYDYVDILFRATTLSSGYNLIRCVKGFNAICGIPGYMAKSSITGSSYNAINLRRTVSVTTSGAINFSNGIVDTTADNANGNANVMIPAKIYGGIF